MEDMTLMNGDLIGRTDDYITYTCSSGTTSSKASKRVRRKDSIIETYMHEQEHLARMRTKAFHEKKQIIFQKSNLTFRIDPSGEIYCSAGESTTWKTQW
jgi:hypothetical protein